MQNIKSNMSLINKSIYFVIAGLAVICTAIFFSTRITGLCLNNETTASIYNDFNIQYNEHNYTTELPIKLKEKTVRERNYGRRHEYMCRNIKL